MNYSGIYFSPTGTSRTSVLTILEPLAKGQEIEELDLTAYRDNYPETVFTKEDFVVFGAPVYGGRIPAVSRPRFDSVKGDKTPCIVTVTYGNRDYDDALLELCELVTANGFVVQGAAALIGQHTYGEIQVGRPNKGDAQENLEFAQRFMEQRAHCDMHTPPALSIKGDHPYKNGGHGGSFTPQPTGDCNQCQICAQECPVNAIDDKSIANGDTCISCFRCIHVCPLDARQMQDPAYTAFAAEFTERLKYPRKNEYFI